MPFEIVKDDAAKMKVDAAVILSEDLPPVWPEGQKSGGVIDPNGVKSHRATPEPGEPVICAGRGAPYRYAVYISARLPLENRRDMEEKLASCYLSSLKIAAENGCHTVALPLISPKSEGYPADRALKIAVGAIKNFLSENDMTVYLAIRDKSRYRIDKELFNDISDYIEENFAAAFSCCRRPEDSDDYILGDALRILKKPDSIEEPEEQAEFQVAEAVKPESREKAEELRDMLRPYPEDLTLGEAVDMIDESFSEMLLRKIDEAGIKDSECYKRANIDRKLFSKIRSDRFYKPSKPTVLSFVIALRLSLEETKEMLMKAGFALSHSNKFDIIVEYFISRGIYDIFRINEALFAFDQSLLICRPSGDQNP